MEVEALTGLVSIIGSAIGTLAGILATSKMTRYRLEQLEKKVDKHNHLVERMIIVEQSCKSAHGRIEELCEIL